MLVAWHWRSTTPPTGDPLNQALIRTQTRTLTALSPVYNAVRSEEHTSELQSLMRPSYAVFCLNKKNKTTTMKYKLNAKHINYNSKHTQHHSHIRHINNHNQSQTHTNKMK